MTGLFVEKYRKKIKTVPLIQDILFTQAKYFLEMESQSHWFTRQAPRKSHHLYGAKIRECPIYFQTSIRWSLKLKK